MDPYKKLIKSAVGHAFLVALIYFFFLLIYYSKSLISLLAVIAGLLSFSLLLFLFNSAKPYSWLTSLASLMAPAVYYLFYFIYHKNFYASLPFIMINIILTVVIVNKIHDFIVEVDNKENEYPLSILRVIRNSAYKIMGQSWYTVFKRKIFIVVFLQIILTCLA